MTFNWVQGSGFRVYKPHGTVNLSRAQELHCCRTILSGALAKASHVLEGGLYTTF